MVGLSPVAGPILTHLLGISVLGIHRLEAKLPWFLPCLKNELLKEAKTVKAGTKFITGDMARGRTHKETVLKLFPSDWGLNPRGWDSNPAKTLPGT